ncbi:hypothetical protein BT96DRAFT_1019406 [Gymnopus androsaceus JB14]|uniref:Uncharacterized protein n=1 Tax=Gymnopus androsaceus JB14 TaxID=1447944 RepID=A0A6A4HQL7_9AGAR|nr:hypothetical protein BT96DRAFT_1019406 [Gymnopus androsaceus JB14]
MRSYIPRFLSIIFILAIQNVVSTPLPKYVLPKQILAKRAGVGWPPFASPVPLLTPNEKKVFESTLDLHLQGDQIKTDAMGNNNGIYHITQYKNHKDLIAKVVNDDRLAYFEVRALKAVQQYVGSGKAKDHKGHEVHVLLMTEEKGQTFTALASKLDEDGKKKFKALLRPLIITAIAEDCSQVPICPCGCRGRELFD